MEVAATGETTVAHNDTCNNKRCHVMLHSEEDTWFLGTQSCETILGDTAEQYPGNHREQSCQYNLHDYRSHILHIMQNFSCTLHTVM